MINKSLNIIDYNGKSYNFLQKELQKAFLDVGILTFRYYPQEKLMIASDFFVEVLGSDRIYSDMPHSLAESFIAEEDRGILYDMAARIDAGERKVSEILRTRSGHISRVTLTSIEQTPDGKNLTMAGLVEDVSESERSSALLEALSQDYSCVYYVDLWQNKVIPHRMDPVVANIYKSKFAENPAYEDCINLYVKSAVVEADQQDMLKVCSRENLQKVFKDCNVLVHDFRARHVKKELYCRMKIVNLSKRGELTHFVMGFSDMSREKVHELEKMAFTDPLTGGDNYNGFKSKVNDLQKSGYLISMDIHQFKLVNSICGVSYGDKVLKHVWDTTYEVFGPVSLTGRVNADHFVMFSSTLTKDDIIAMIGELSEKLYQLSVKMRCPRLFPYFGITEYSPEKRVEEAYSETTVAKHAIKVDSKINYLFYTKNEDAKIMKSKALSDAFPTAMAERRFEVWYQPKYSPTTKKIIGAEALVRWRWGFNGSDKLVPPGDFIPLFESNGLIRTLDEYVFDSVCRFIKRRIKNGFSVVPVSVNLSRASLFTEGIVDQYRNIVDDIGIDASLVPIEITESATFNHDELFKIIEDFRKKGFSLSVDDFGTGYSTLSLLSRRQFDNLKLDKSLIDDITGDDGYKLIKHTVALSKDLGMNVTAEGVEDVDQLDILVQLGCDSIQGFLFSPPVPESEFVFKLDN